MSTTPAAPKHLLTPLAGIAAASSRLWTRSLGVAFVIVIAAFLLTFIPFAVIFFESLLQKSLYASFVAAIEEVYFGLIAITVSSVLNYVEGQDGRGLGHICASLTVVSFLCTFIALFGYMFAHFRGSLIFDPARDEGGFVIFTLVFAFICVMFSMMNILESRRMKDKIADYEEPVK